jgi:alkaline phosphatase D
MIKIICFSLVSIISWNLCAQNRELPVEPCMAPFYHGVASGDPLHDRVIIWTRITPDTSFTFPVIVQWRMATDTGMTNIVSSGSVITTLAQDYTVKVDVTGLSANTFYFYEFSGLGANSIRGRTKTSHLSSADSVRFGIVSCANLEAGYFNVYGSLAQRNDIDAVICLGDYIYEYEAGGYAFNATVNRHWDPVNEIISLADYRMRYSTYHLDPDLRKCHQQYPFICVWDDHETANDAYKSGAENHDAGTEGSYAVRKQCAQQAYFEWLPIRVTGTTDPYQIFRNIKYGDLVELIMLDTRLHGRDIQAGTSGSVVTDIDRQLLGIDQFTWLGNRLDSTSAQWKVLAQQVMMAPLTVFGAAVNGDQWDGYPAERDRVFNHILGNNIKDVVVITGDIHSSWANDLPTASYNPSTGAGSVGVEFVTPSVTSPGLSIPGGSTVVMASNPHMKYVDLSEHGYTILDLNLTRAQSDWYFINTIDASSTAFTYETSFYANHLERFLTAGGAAAVPRPQLNYIQSPLCPRPFTTGVSDGDNYHPLIGLYPNPVSDFAVLQYISDKNQQIIITDLTGKIVIQSPLENLTPGIVAVKTVATNHLTAGVYILTFVGESGKQSIKFIKN